MGICAVALGLVVSSCKGTACSPEARRAMVSRSRTCIDRAARMVRAPELASSLGIAEADASASAYNGAVLFRAREGMKNEARIES